MKKWYSNNIVVLLLIVLFLLNNVLCSNNKNNIDNKIIINNDNENNNNNNNNNSNSNIITLNVYIDNQSNQTYTNGECGLIMNYKEYLCLNYSNSDCTNQTNNYNIPPCKSIYEGVDRVNQFINQFKNSIQFNKSHLYYYINNGTYYAVDGNTFNNEVSSFSLFKKTFINSGVNDNQYNLKFNNYVVIDGTGYNNSYFLSNINNNRNQNNSSKYNNIPSDDGNIISIGNLNFINFNSNNDSDSEREKELFYLNNQDSSPYPNAFYISYINFKKISRPIVSMYLEGVFIMEYCNFDQINTGNGISPFYFENMYISWEYIRINNSSSSYNSFISIHDSNLYFQYSILENINLKTQFNNFDHSILSIHHSNFEIVSNTFENNQGKQIFIDNSNFNEEFIELYKNEFISNINTNTNSFITIIEMEKQEQQQQQQHKQKKEQLNVIPLMNSTIYEINDCLFKDNQLIEDTNNNCLIELNTVNFGFTKSKIQCNSNECINFITFNSINSIINIEESYLTSNRLIIGKNNEILIHNSNISSDHSNYNLCIDCNFDIIDQSSSTDIETGSTSTKISSIGETIKLVFLIMGGILAVMLIYYLIYNIYNKILSKQKEYNYQKIN